MKLATAGKAFGYWNKKEIPFNLNCPLELVKQKYLSWVYLASMNFTSARIKVKLVSHVSWEDYDYEYKLEAYMLDREFIKLGRHPMNAPHELRSARRVGGTMGMDQGPAYFTRSRSSPVRRPRSYSRSPSKTPERKRSYSESPSRSPVRCPSIRSCTRS